MSDTLRPAADYRMAISKAKEAHNHVLTVVSTLHQEVNSDQLACGVQPLVSLLDHLTCEVAEVLHDALGTPIEPGEDCGYKVAQQWACDLADRFDENRDGTGFKAPITLDLDRFYAPLAEPEKRKFVEALGALVLEHLVGTSPVFEAWDPQEELAWMSNAHLDPKGDA